MFALGVLAVPTVEAQQPQRIVQVQYRKSAPGKAADQRRFVETSWKKFTQVAVDEGRLQGAVVLRLTTPFAAGSAFDYATVSFPAKRPSFAGPDRATGEAQARKAGFASLQAYLDAGNSVSTAVRAEWLNTAMRIGAMQEGNYVRTTRQMVDQPYRQPQMEFFRDVMLKVNATGIKEGRIVGWAVQTLPGAVMSADEAGFSQSVAIVYKDADAVWTPPGQMTEERLKKAIPSGLSLSAFVNRQRDLAEHRKNVGTRIWEVVSAVGKAPEIQPAGQ